MWDFCHKIHIWNWDFCSNPLITFSVNLIYNYFHIHNYNKNIKKQNRTVGIFAIMKKVWDFFTIWGAGMSSQWTLPYENSAIKTSTRDRCVIENKTGIHVSPFFLYWGIFFLFILYFIYFVFNYLIFYLLF